MNCAILSHIFYVCLANQSKLIKRSFWNSISNFGPTRRFVKSIRFSERLKQVLLLKAIIFPSSSNSDTMLKKTELARGYVRHG